MAGDTLKACEAVFQLRDAIAVSLRVRKGMELNEIVILERANNMAMALVEQFEIRKRDDETDDTAIGTIRPPEETAEELARRLIK